jgi:hypothetical protein
MARHERFTFLCNTEERRAIVDLAARLQRSESDAVRFVIVETVKQLTEMNATPLLKDPNHIEGGNHATG